MDFRPDSEAHSAFTEGAHLNFNWHRMTVLRLGRDFRLHPKFAHFLYYNVEFSLKVLEATQVSADPWVSACVSDEQFISITNSFSVPVVIGILIPASISASGTTQKSGRILSYSAGFGYDLSAHFDGSFGP